MCKETSVPSPWLKVSQAREYLQMDNGALRRLIKSGEIRSVRRGNTTFVRVEWLDTWMESLPSGAAPLATVVGGATSRAS